MKTKRLGWGIAFLAVWMPLSVCDEHVMMVDRESSIIQEYHGIWSQKHKQEIQTHEEAMAGTCRVHFAVPHLSKARIREKERQRKRGKKTCHNHRVYAHFNSEHQPRRQKIRKRELLISTDRKTLEKVVLGLRSLGAKIFVVNMSHEFQAMSTIQEIITG